MNWNIVVEESKYSILKLEAHNNISVDCLKPYASNSTEVSYGSGFIFDIENGLVLTASSLVYNNLVIRGKTEIDESYCLRLNLFCICPEYGFAVCQMREEDKKYIQDRVNSPEKLNVKIQCELIQVVGQEALILGYQQNIVSAQISKWQSPTDVYRRLSLSNDLKYVGAPVFNKEGYCIGLLIKIDDVYKCLLMHTIINMYPLVSKIGILSKFNLGISWSKTSVDFNKRFTFNNDSPEIIGVYVNKLQPGTFLSEINNEDIIMSISYTDNIIGKTGTMIELLSLSSDDEAAKLETAKFEAAKLEAAKSEDVKSEDKLKESNVIAIIDNSGYVDLYHKKNNKVKGRFIPHKIKLRDILKFIPYESNITINICRNGILRELESTIIYRSIYRVDKIQAQYHPCDFEIIAGMCLSVLNLNHVEHLKCPHLYYFVQGSNKFVPHLVITNIYVDSTLYDVDIFKPGDVITKINGHVIQNIDQLRQILIRQPSGLEFVNHRDKKYYISRERAVYEDKNSIKAENIRGLMYHW